MWTGDQPDQLSDTAAVGDPSSPGAAQPPLIPILVEGAFRGALAMLAGFAATAALALVLWTITPTSTSGPEPQLSGAVAAYVLAHFGDIRIGAATLTLTPLLLTVLFGLLLAFGPGRGRIAGSTVAGELLSVGSGAVTYAVLVTVAALTLGPTGARDGWVALWSLVFAAAALGSGMWWHGSAVRTSVAERVPSWVRAGVGAAAGAVVVLIGGAALAVAGALVTSFATAAELNATVANSVGDGIALTVVGIGYLPNLVLAAVGYLTGTGFTVGAGSYSPFGSVPADLPPFPVLAAVPTSTDRSSIGLLLLIVPVLAGLTAALLVNRRVAERQDRALAVLIAAGGTGLITGLLVWSATGGVVGGPWPQMGANGWWAGLVAAVAVLVIAGAWVLAADYRHDAVGAIRTARDKVFDRPGAPGSAGADAGADSEPTMAGEVAEGETVESTDGDSDLDGDLDSEPDGGDDEPGPSADLDSDLDSELNGGDDDPGQSADLDSDLDSDLDGEVDGGVDIDEEHAAVDRAVPAVDGAEATGDSSDIGDEPGTADPGSDDPPATALDSDDPLATPMDSDDPPVTAPDSDGDTSSARPADASPSDRESPQPRSPWQ